MAKVFKVFVGIGHGGKDPGAVANGFEEADLNLDIGMACCDELARHGVSVLASRTKDEDDDLAEEIAECNAYDPDLCADIHNNAGGGDGVEVFHHHGGGNSKKMAQNILDAIVEIGQNSRGLKTKMNSTGTADYYGFIRCTKAPAVVVECAFVDNKKDIQIIDTKAERKAMGVAIAKGILKTLGITYKKEETKVTAKKFNDEAKIPSWASDAVKKVSAAGIMVGDDKGNFRPNDPVTRAELAVAIARAHKL